MKKPISRLTADQTSLLLSNAWGRTQERDRQMITFLLHTGLKISEFINLNVRSVYTGRRVRSVLVIPGRNSNPARRIPLAREAREAIASLLEYNRSQGQGLSLDDAFVTSRQRNHRDGSYRITSRQVQRIVKGMGQDPAMPTRTTPQVLRHTFAASLLGRGLNMHQVQQLLGHGALKTTRDLYSGLGKSEEGPSLENVPPPPLPLLQRDETAGGLAALAG